MDAISSPLAGPFERCVDIEIPLGEGPVWDAQRGVVWFVDIPASAIFSYCPRTGKVRRYEMPDWATSIGLAADDRLVVSLRTAVVLFSPRTGAIDLLAEPDVGAPVNRLNDGKVGPDGCFWVGSMHAVKPAQPTAALFRIAPSGGCETKLDGLRVSNGLAWSPDHRTMFHADTRAPAITAYDFDPATGAMTLPRVIARPGEAEGLPDGAAVDVDGNYWSAGVTSGQITVFAPGGGVLGRIVVPMAAPTMVCFGGDDLKTLFVTGLTRPEGGATAFGGLWSCRVKRAGAPVGRFGNPLFAT